MVLKIMTNFRECSVFLLLLFGRRRSTGLQHLLQHLRSDSPHAFVLCYGIVGQLIIVPDVTCHGIPMLIRRPLIFGHISVAWNKEGDHERIEGT